MSKMTKCAKCGETGGRFRFRSGMGDWVHAGRCVPEIRPMHGTHANWPLITGHLGDPNLGPVRIENLPQLRAAEKLYGCSSDAYNMDRGSRSE